MLKDLSPGLKISITRSINTAFEQYMSKIDWNEDQYDLEAFVVEWKEYINHTASWYEKVSNETKADPVFHAELAVKINETIEKIINEEPTQDQVDEIEFLEKQVASSNRDYSCRAEARYVIEQLKKSLKKS